MQQYPDLRKNKTNLYVGYWAAYVLLFSLIEGLPTNDLSTSFINELISLPPRIIFVYLVTQVYMPGLFLQKRMIGFITIYLLTVLVLALGQRIIDNNIILEYFLTHWTKEPLLSVPPYLYHIIKLQFVVAVPFTVKLFFIWSNERNKALEIQNDKMKTELQLLRSQFQPHFMFNVLNSLYSRTLSKSDESAEIVLKISDMLRYAVYESREKVILHDEINYLRNYVALQQTRFDNNLEISFAVEGITTSHKIEPFLIMPLIENSFKYCMTSESTSGWITIFIEALNGQLHVKVENSLPQTINSKTGNQSNRYGGVGLLNVKRRLELLYPNEHILKTVEGSESYFVYLKIKLDGI